MCGNFGLLLLKQQEHTAYQPDNTRCRSESDEDASLHMTMVEVERLGGIRASHPTKNDHEVSDNSAHYDDSVHTALSGGSSLDASYHSASFPATGKESNHGESLGKNKILDPIKILEAQIACTEIRGNFKLFHCSPNHISLIPNPETLISQPGGQAGGISSIEYDSDDKHLINPLNARVRCVARKRIALSTDLARLYERSSTYNQSRLRKSKRACNMTFVDTPDLLRAL